VAVTATATTTTAAAAAAAVRVVRRGRGADGVARLPVRHF
jgi:hypothetical protein